MFKLIKLNSGHIAVLFDILIQIHKTRQFQFI